MRLLLLTCFVALGLLANAQTTRPTRTPAKGKTTRSRSVQRPKSAAPAPVAAPAVAYKDTLYRLDKSALLVKIDELAETSVVYRSAATGTAKQTVARAEVWKVVFSDGSQEVVTPLEGSGANTSAKATDPAPSATTPPPTGQAAADYVARNRSAAYTRDKQFSRFHLTIGPEGYLFGLTKTNRWTNDLSGLGMSQTVGASLRLDFRFARAIALSVTGGYTRWQLIRNYALAGVERYDETVELTRIPVLVGIKLYAGNLYLLPEGGVNLLTERITTSGAHPKPTNTQSNSTPVSYGGSLGYEFHLGGFLIDVSGRYQFLDVKDLSVGTVTPLLTEKIQFASLRVGLGFATARK